MQLTAVILAVTGVCLAVLEQRGYMDMVFISHNCSGLFLHIFSWYLSMLIASWSCNLVLVEHLLRMWGFPSTE